MVGCRLRDKTAIFLVVAPIEATHSAVTHQHCVSIELNVHIYNTTKQQQGSLVAIDSNVIIDEYDRNNDDEVAI